MRRIYVRFPGDNDFISTVKPFVRVIASRIMEEDLQLSKAKIVELFNEHAFSLYMLHQSPYMSESGEEQKRLKDYLKIQEKDVYFDDEIDSFTNYNHDGCMACKLGDGAIEYYVW